MYICQHKFEANHNKIIRLKHLEGGIYTPSFIYIYIKSFWRHLSVSS